MNGRTLQGRPRLTARAAALLVAVAVLALIALVPAREVLAERATIAALDRQSAALERRNDGLRLRIGELSDPVVLERLARECLGMVRPGEIALVQPGGTLADTRC